MQPITKRIADSISAESSQILFQIDHPTTLSAILHKMIIQQLCDQKSAVIVSENAEVLKTIQKDLSATAIASFVMSIEDNLLTEVDIVRCKSQLQKLMGHKFMPRTQNGNDSTSFYQEVHCSKYLNRPMIQWAGRYDLTSSLPYQDTFHFLIDSIDFGTSSDVFASMKNSIERACQLYHIDFKAYEHLPFGIHDSFISSRKSSISELNKFCRRSKDLLDRLSRELLRKKRASNDLEYSNRNKIQGLLADLDECLKKASLLSAEEVKETIWNVYYQYCSLVQRTYNEKLKMDMDLAEKLKTSLLAMQESFHRSMKSDRLKMEQINLHNCGESIRSIVDECNELYADINAANIINKYLSDNGFNIHESYNYLLKINESLENLAILVSVDNSILDWLKFKIKLSTSEKVLVESFEKVYSNYAHWEDIFEVVYFQKLFRKVMTKYPNPMGNKIAQVDTSFCIDDLFYTRSKSLKELVSNENAEIQQVVNQLLKKKASHLTLEWKELQANGLLDQLFPIRLMTETTYDYLSNSFDHDAVVFIQSEEKNRREDLQVLDNPYYKILYPSQTYQTVQHPEFEIFEFVKPITFLNRNTPIALNHNDLASEIGYHLEEYDSNAFYLSNDDVKIIGFFGAPLSNAVIEYYTSTGFKQILLNTFSNINLTNVLLASDRKGYFFTLDGLIDPSSYESATWQAVLISKMIELGWEQIDVSFHSVLGNGNTAFFISEIYEKNQLSHV